MNGNKEMFYREPCRYCDKMIPPESVVCPSCSRINPLGPIRCPKCRNLVDESSNVCAHCGMSLEIECPKCGRMTFYEEYCEYCGMRLRGIQILAEKIAGVCIH
jgi:RNA polymerase subunit RPABC4/transcription elongation factor Spt4